jgi:hypothetical protein
MSALLRRRMKRATSLLRLRHNKAALKEKSADEADFSFSALFLLESTRIAPYEI